MKRTKKERNSRGSSDKRQLNPDGSDYQIKPITRINAAARPPMERIPIDFLTFFVSPFRSVAGFQESKGIWSQAVSTSSEEVLDHARGKGFWLWWIFRSSLTSIGR